MKECGLTKADYKKICKLEDILSKLKSGEKKYYEITTLTSIKSLCKDERIRRQYCAYLFLAVYERIKTENVKTPHEDVNESKILELISKVEKIIVDYSGEKREQELLRTCCYKLQEYQSDYKKIRSTIVRMVKSMNFLIIEETLLCLITEDTVSQKLIYSATRYFVEAYDSSVGTGIIAKSIPMFEDVVMFWKNLAYQESVK